MAKFKKIEKSRRTEYANEFARRLEARMTYLKINQKRLSDITGISQGQIHKYLHDHSIPKVDTAVRLAFGLAMPVENLVDFIVEK